MHKYEQSYSRLLFSFSEMLKFLAISSSQFVISFEKYFMKKNSAINENIMLLALLSDLNQDSIR